MINACFLQRAVFKFHLMNHAMLCCVLTDHAELHLLIEPVLGLDVGCCQNIHVSLHHL